MGIKTFTHTVIERSIGRFGHELKLVGSPANSTAKCGMHRRPAVLCESLTAFGGVG